MSTTCKLVEVRSLDVEPCLLAFMYMWDNSRWRVAVVNLIDGCGCYAGPICLSQKEAALEWKTTTDYWPSRFGTAASLEDEK